jgi:hypothetical protein
MNSTTTRIAYAWSPRCRSRIWYATNAISYYRRPLCGLSAYKATTHSLADIKANLPASTPSAQRKGKSNEQRHHFKADTFEEAISQAIVAALGSRMSPREISLSS